MVRICRLSADKNGAPAIGGKATVTIETDGWHTVYPTGRAAGASFLHTRRIGPADTTGTFVVCGEAQRVEAISRSADDSWTFADLRKADGTATSAVSAAWPDDRPRDKDGDLVDGRQDPIALRCTVAGYDYDKDADQ